MNEYECIPDILTIQFFL